MIALGYPIYNGLEVVTRSSLHKGSYLTSYDASRVETEVLGTILSSEAEKAHTGDSVASVQVDIWENPEVSRLSQDECPLSEQCVSLLQENGFDIWGDAWEIKPTHYKGPSPGDGILFNSHVAIIQKITSDSYEIVEKNFKDCSVISTRSVPFSDPGIRGFLRR